MNPLHLSYVKFLIFLHDGNVAAAAAAAAVVFVVFCVEVKDSEFKFSQQGGVKISQVWYHRCSRL